VTALMHSKPWHLPALLSVIAGAVDVIGFLSLGLFTAHITGNLVIIATLLVHGGVPNVPQIVAVPVFMVTVAVVWFIVRTLKRRGTPIVRSLLVLQLLLLMCVMVLSVTHTPDRYGLKADVTAMIAVSAMACQFALLRIALPGAPSTAVMTGNLTNTVLSALDVLSREEPLTAGAHQRLRKAFTPVVGFVAGCLAGAVADLWLADWAWSLPVALAAVATALPSSRF